VNLEQARAAVARLDSILDADDGPFSCHFARDGAISARGRGMTAACPFPWLGTALVAGAELKRVLSRLGSDPAVEQDDKGLTFRCGKLRASVDTLPASEGVFPEEPLDEGSVELDASFISRLNAILPFISDEPSPPWVNCLLVARGRASAVGSGATVFATTAIPDLGADILIPKRALSIALASDPEPISISANANRTTFRWADGSWLSCQNVAGKVPETVAQLVARSAAGATAPELSEAWKEAFARVAGFADGRITLTATTIKAARGKAEIEDEAENVLPKGKDSAAFDAALARLVAAEADRWDTSLHPAPWSGELLRGLIGGLR
jgi:hypothetical protein